MGREQSHLEQPERRHSITREEPMNAIHTLPLLNTARIVVVYGYGTSGFDGRAMCSRRGLNQWSGRTTSAKPVTAGLHSKHSRTACMSGRKRRPVPVERITTCWRSSLGAVSMPFLPRPRPICAPGWLAIDDGPSKPIAIVESGFEPRSTAPVARPWAIPS